MHVAINLAATGEAPGSSILRLSAVAFELNGTQLEAHELLQLNDRWLDLPIAPYLGLRDRSHIDRWRATPAYQRHLDSPIPVLPLDEALARLDRFTAVWRGVRGSVWYLPFGWQSAVLGHAYGSALARGPEWGPAQERDFATLFWTARQARRRPFSIPDLRNSGMIEHYPLHTAVVQAVSAQAAFRVLQLTGG